MDLTNLNWLFILWNLTKKYTQDYKDKDGKDRVAYRLKFDYMGWTYQVNCDDVIYTKLEEWLFYAVEVGVFTSEGQKFASLSTNKTKKVYELNDNWYTDLL